MRHFIFPLLCVIILSGCFFSEKHKKASEIYESGVMDTTEFILRSHDEIHLSDTLMYKYDTNLLVERGFYENSKLRGYIFFYKKKAEGNAFFYDANGLLGGKAHYLRGKLDGDFLVYENGILLRKVFYETDSAIYVISYDKNGSVVDSSGLETQE